MYSVGLGWGSKVHFEPPPQVMQMQAVHGQYRDRMLTWPLGVAQLGLIYSHASHTLREVLSIRRKSCDKMPREKKIIIGPCGSSTIGAANSLVTKMDKHGSPALFMCGKRSLFLLYAVFGSHLTSDTFRSILYSLVK